MFVDSTTGDSLHSQIPDLLRPPHLTGEGTEAWKGTLVLRVDEKTEWLAGKECFRKAQAEHRGSRGAAEAAESSEAV